MATIRLQTRQDSKINLTERYMGEVPKYFINRKVARNFLDFGVQ